MAALAGVIWAAKEFVQSRWVEKEVARLTKVKNWRKIAIHKLLMTSTKYRTTKSITDELKVGSYDAEIQIEKDELSEAAVRGVLLEMISDGALGQVFPDQYGITQIHRDITAQATAENIESQRAARTAFAELSKHPARYTSKELFDEIGNEFGLSESDFSLAILQLENNNAAKRDLEGRWSPINSKEI